MRRSLEQFSICQQPCARLMLCQHILSFAALSCFSERQPPPTCQLGMLSFGDVYYLVTTGHIEMSGGATPAVIKIFLMCELDPVTSLGEATQRLSVKAW